jgi:hypothetical protein
MYYSLLFCENKWIIHLEIPMQRKELMDDEDKVTFNQYRGNILVKMKMK